jgi:hypothetical protein
MKRETKLASVLGSRKEPPTARFHSLESNHGYSIVERPAEIHVAAAAAGAGAVRSGHVETLNDEQNEYLVSDMKYHIAPRTPLHH